MGFCLVALTDATNKHHANRHSSSSTTSNHIDLLKNTPNHSVEQWCQVIMERNSVKKVCEARMKTSGLLLSCGNWCYKHHANRRSSVCVIKNPRIRWTSLKAFNLRFFFGFKKASKSEAFFGFKIEISTTSNHIALLKNTPNHSVEQ